MAPAVHEKKGGSNAEDCCFRECLGSAPAYERMLLRARYGASPDMEREPPDDA